MLYRYSAVLYTGGMTSQSRISQAAHSRPAVELEELVGATVFACVLDSPEGGVRLVLREARKEWIYRGLTTPEEVSWWLAQYRFAVVSDWQKCESVECECGAEDDGEGACEDCYEEAQLCSCGWGECDCDYKASDGKVWARIVFTPATSIKMFEEQAITAQPARESWVLPLGVSREACAPDDIGQRNGYRQLTVTDDSGKNVAFATVWYKFPCPWEKLVEGADHCPESTLRQGPLVVTYDYGSPLKVHTTICSCQWVDPIVAEGLGIVINALLRSAVGDQLSAEGWDEDRLWQVAYEAWKHRG